MAIENGYLTETFGLKRVRNTLSSRPVHGATLAVVVAAIVLILFVDRPIALYVQDHLDSWVVDFLRGLTEVGDGTIYIVASVLFWLGFGWLSRQDFPIETTERFEQIARYGAFALTALLSTGAVLTVLKYLIGRLRPSALLVDGAYGFAPLSFDSGAISLPSGHSQVAWTVVTIALLLRPRIGLMLIPVAILVAASRVAIDVHFVSDVILGAYVGIVVPLIVYACLFPRLCGAPERVARVRRILGLSR